MGDSIKPTLSKLTNENLVIAGHVLMLQTGSICISVLHSAGFAAGLGWDPVEHQVSVRVK